MFQKHQYVRSKKLLKLVAGLDCQACGSGNMVQAAHTNWVVVRVGALRLTTIWWLRCALNAITKLTKAKT